MNRLFDVFFLGLINKVLLKDSDFFVNFVFVLVVFFDIQLFLRFFVNFLYYLSDFGLDVRNCQCLMFLSYFCVDSQ